MDLIIKLFVKVGFKNGPAGINLKFQQSGHCTRTGEMQNKPQIYDARLEA